MGGAVYDRANVFVIWHLAKQTEVYITEIRMRGAVYHTAHVFVLWHLAKQTEVYSTEIRMRGAVYHTAHVFVLWHLATRNKLDGPGIESRWGRDFQHSYRPALVPTQHPVQWVTGHSRGKAAGAWR